MLYKQIGERAKKLRKKHRLTETELGKLLILSRASIVNFEAGRQAIPLIKLLLLCYFFDTTLEELLKGYSIESLISKKTIETLKEQEPTHYKKIVSNLISLKIKSD